MSNSNGFRLELISTNDFIQLPSLMKNCFNTDIDIHYFNWKYNNNPSGKAICIAIKNEANEIIAFEALIPEDYIVHKEKMIFYQSSDTMTHSSYRKRGLYQKIAFKGFDILKEKNNLFEIGFGGSISTPIILSFGWEILFHITYFFKTFLHCYLSTMSYSKSNSSFSIKSINNLNEIVQLYNLQPHSFIHKYINFDTLQWRLSHPLYSFKKIGIYNSRNNLEAYIIYFFQNNKIFVYDFGFNQNNGNFYLKRLFKEVDNIVINNKLRGVLTFAQNHCFYAKVLKRNGFIYNPFGFGTLSHRIPFMIYTDNKEINKFYQPNFWSVTPIYHDSL